MSTKHGTLGDYLLQFKKQTGQTQTHTWFSPTKGINTLSIPIGNNEEFLERVFAYISKTNSAILENPKRGENSITEKVIPTVNKFRMFADIDFGVELFEKHDLPTDLDTLKTYMRDLVNTYDLVITDIYGADYTCDRVVAIRLPYKIHIIYPSVIVNKQIAENLANRFIAKLKEDARFSKVLSQNEKLVDKSVYGTGLRMVGMHKSTMGKKEKTEKEWRTHENIFGENTYTHCYHFVDDNFEDVPLNWDLFKQSSIRVNPDEHDYTTAIDESLLSSFIKKNKGKAKASLVTTTLKQSFSQVGSSSSFFGPNALDSVEDEDEEGFPVQTRGFTQQMLITSLSGTIKFLKKTYNHLMNEEKIKYRERQEEDGTITGSLVFPLETKECHFVGRAHADNHQYLLVDKHGSRQKCHDREDPECKHKEHKPVKPGRMPTTVRDEMIKLNVFRPDVLVKKSKKEPSNEQKLSAVNDLVDRVREYYPKNDLLIDNSKVVINDFGIHIGLRDLWCEVCKKRHEKPSTYLLATETGKMCLKCEENPMIGLFYPNPPVQIDPTTRQFFFANCNVSIVSNNIHNYGDNTGDVSLDFEEEPIFDDEILNHLIYESLAATTWPIVKVIHHLGKYHFNCTKDGTWYAFKHHKWLPNTESAFLYFISETVANYYRQVRDFYKDNSETDELRNKRMNFIQTKIIDKLTNVNSKMEVVKEAKTFFYEEDYYAIIGSNKHFEDLLDSRRHLLAFTNGVYDLDKDEFRDGDPYDFVTLTVGFPFDPESDPEKRKLLEDFFSSMQPDDEEREYLLLFLSSMLHGMTNEEFFHIFTGAAANGKSLLRDLISFSLGEYFESIPANLLTKERPSSSSPQPEIVKLKGKRAVFGSEPEQGQKINTGFMKFITGNDPMQARLLHSNTMVNFQPHFKLVLLCNEIPATDSNDNGTWRRSRIVEFPVVFCDNPKPGHRYEKKIDRTLKERIAGCKEEFIIFLMEYFRKYKAIGSLKPTAKVDKMVQKHKKKSNPVLQFVEEKTEEAPGHAILVVEMYTKYTQFMRAENPGEPIQNKIKMIEELQRMRNVDFSKSVRCKGRKGPQAGLRNRKFIDEDEDKDGDEAEDADGYTII